MLTARQSFYAAYRVGRMLHHQYACMAALKQLPPEAQDYITPAMMCASRARCGEWKFAIQSAKSVKKNGLSGSKCLAIHRRAIDYRRGQRLAGGAYYPATKFKHAA